MSKKTKANKKIHPAFEGLAEAVQGQINRTGLSEAKVAKAVGMPASSLSRILSGRDSAPLRGVLRLKMVLGIPLTGSGKPMAKPPILSDEACSAARAEADAISDSLPSLVRAARLSKRLLSYQFGQRQSIILRVERDGHNIAYGVLFDVLEKLGMPVDTRKAAWNRYRDVAARIAKRKGEERARVHAEDVYAPAELKRIRAAWRKLNQAAAKKYLSIFLRNVSDRQSVNIAAFASDYQPTGDFEYPPVNISFKTPEECSARALEAALLDGAKAMAAVSRQQMERNLRRRQDRQTREQWSDIDRKTARLTGNQEISDLVADLLPPLDIKVDLAPKRPAAKPSNRKPPMPKLTGAAAEALSELRRAGREKGYKIYRKLLNHDGAWVVAYLAHPKALKEPVSLKSTRGPAQVIPTTATPEQVAMALATLRKRVLVSPAR